MADPTTLHGAHDVAALRIQVHHVYANRQQIREAGSPRPQHTAEGIEGGLRLPLKIGGSSR